MTDVSHCCKAPVFLATHEGASCYTCSTCNNPCYVFCADWSPGSEPWQPVDAKEPNDTGLFLSEKMPSFYIICLLQLYFRDKTVLLTQDYDRMIQDIDRLKRLHENVQRQIKIANRMHEWASKHGFEVAFYDEQVELLEGLYK
jgi:hypothetical protein